MTWLSHLLFMDSPSRRPGVRRDRVNKRRRRALALEEMERRIVLSNVTTSFAGGVLTITSNVNSSAANGFSIAETTAAAGGKVTVASTTPATTINSSGSPYTTPGAVTAIKVVLTSPTVSFSETVTIVGAGQGVATSVKTVDFNVSRTNLTLNVGAGGAANGVDNTGAFTLRTTGGLTAEIDDSTFSALTIDQSQGCCPASIELNNDVVPGSVNVALGKAGGDRIVLQGDKFGSTTLSEGQGDGDYIGVFDSTIKDLSAFQGDGDGDSIDVERVLVSLVSFGVVTVQGGGDGDFTTINDVSYLVQAVPPNNPSVVPSIDVTQGDGEGDVARVSNSDVSNYIEVTQGEGDGDVAVIGSSNTVYGSISIIQGSGKGDSAAIQSSISLGGWIATFQGDGEGDGAGIYSSQAALDVSIHQGDGKADTASISASTSIHSWVATFQGNGDRDQASIFNATAYLDVSIHQGDGEGDSATMNSATSSNSWVAVFQGDGDSDLATMLFSNAYLDVSIHQGAGDFANATIFFATSSNSWIAVFQGDGNGDGAFVSFGTAALDVSIYQGDGDNDIATISIAFAAFSQIIQGDGDGDYASMTAMYLGSAYYAGDYAFDVDGDAIITQGDGYHDVAVINAGGGIVNQVNNIYVTQGDNVFSPGCDPGLGDEVHINDTVVTSDVAIVQGTSDAADAGGSIATIGDVGDVVAGGHVSIYQNGGGNQVVLGGPSSSFAANYLDVWTGGLGGGFVTAQNTTVVWGSWFGLDFVIDGGGEGNTYYDAGDNSGVSASDNYNDV